MRCEIKLSIHWNDQEVYYPCIYESKLGETIAARYGMKFLWRIVKKHVGPRTVLQQWLGVTPMQATRPQSTKCYVTCRMIQASGRLWYRPRSHCSNTTTIKTASPLTDMIGPVHTAAITTANDQLYPDANLNYVIHRQLIPSHHGSLWTSNSSGHDRPRPHCSPCIDKSQRPAIT